MGDSFEIWMDTVKKLEEKLNSESILIFKLSTTERQEFKECRRRWDFGSLSRQAIEPNRPAIALWFGTGIHHALEMYYSNEPFNDGDKELSMASDPYKCVDLHWRDWCKKEIARIEESQVALWDEQKEELQKMVELGSGMLQNYITWAAKEDSSTANGFKEVLYTEREFEVPLLNDDGSLFIFKDGNDQQWAIFLVGRLDMVVKDFEDRLWILDHKTSKDRLDPEILTLDDQMTLYLWAVQQIIGSPLEGCYYNVLRKKLPSEPQMLKSGGLSKSKMIDTTYDVYLQAIFDNGLDPADYEDILDYLVNKDCGFFTRAKVHRNKHEIDMAGRMLRMEAIDMLNAPYIYPNPTRDCKWKCDYMPLCIAMNRNDDVAFMINSMYRPRVKEEDSVYNRERTNG